MTSALPAIARGPRERTGIDGARGREAGRKRESQRKNWSDERGVTLNVKRSPACRQRDDNARICREHIPRLDK